MSDATEPELSIQDTLVSDPLINQVLESRYRIETEVGRGGMGIVYRGTDLTLSRPVAIKTILHRDADDQALNRFIKEARTLAQIENHRLVPVYAVGQDDGYHYLVMKFLEGETLATRLKREGQLAVDMVRDLVQQVCEALNALHDRNLLHRDIKPANLMIAPDGQITVMDLGIAKEIGEETVTTSFSTIGTPRYMPPEAIDNQPLDPRSDLYSLGIIAYLASTGQMPFDGPTPMSILYKQAHEEARPVRELNSHLPKNLESAIEIALQKSPNDRFQNAQEMSQAFERNAQFKRSDSWKYSIFQVIILLIFGASLSLVVKNYYTSSSQKITLDLSNRYNFTQQQNKISSTDIAVNQIKSNQSTTQNDSSSISPNSSNNTQNLPLPNYQETNTKQQNTKKQQPTPQTQTPKNKTNKNKSIRIRVSSTPPGVYVYMSQNGRRTLMGKTPFAMSKKDKKSTKYIAKLKGFHDQTFTLSAQKTKFLRMRSLF